MLDRLAGILRTAGRDQVRLGYEIPYGRWMLTWHHIDPNVMIGRELDVALLWKHGICNLNELPEGLSPEDEFRILQRRRGDAFRTWRLREREPVAFDVVEDFGNYALLRRAAAR